MRKKIIISVICYGNEEEVINFADLLSQQVNSKNLVLIISCNKVNDFEMLKNGINKINIESYIYNPNSNIGYLPGMLYGLEMYLTNVSSDFDWVLMSNTDVSFGSQDYFDRFMNVNFDSDIWCVGPDIILTNNNKHQNPFLIKRPTIKKIKFWKLVYSNIYAYNLYYFFYRLKSKIIKNTVIYDNECQVYAVHGSSFFIKRECVKQLCNLKKITFMYEEELLVSEVINKFDKKVYYYPNLHLYHNENQVTGKVKNKRKLIWSRDSINLIYNNFFKEE